MSFGNLCDLKKQSPSCIFKPSLITGNRECLTRKACTQQVKFRRYHCLNALSRNVSKRYITEIMVVGALCIYVYL